MTRQEPTTHPVPPPLTLHELSWPSSAVIQRRGNEGCADRRNKRFRQAQFEMDGYSEERMLAAKRTATRGGSVCLSSSSLWSAGRPNNTPSPPPPSYLAGDRLSFLDGAFVACSSAAPSGFAAPSASPPPSPDEDVDGFVPEEAVGPKRGLVRGRGSGAGDLR